MQIRGQQHNSNKSDKTYTRTYPKKNWEIYKALVYYGARARKNRKIAFARNSMGNRYRPIDKREMELRDNLYRKLCKRKNNKLHNQKQGGK